MLVVGRLQRRWLPCMFRPGNANTHSDRRRGHQKTPELTPDRGVFVFATSAYDGPVSTISVVGPLDMAAPRPGSLWDGPTVIPRQGLA